MREIAFGPDNALYVSHRVTNYGRDGSIYEVALDGSVRVFAADMVHPKTIVWGGGTEYGEYLYVADKFERSTWSTGEVTRIDLNGNTSPFAGSGLNQPWSLAIDRNGNYGGYMYVGSGAYDRINKVFPNGQTELFYSFGPTHTLLSPWAIAFDPAGDYGGLMYVGLAYADQSLLGGVVTFDPEGNLGSFAPDLTHAYHLEFDTTGLMFGGDLYVYGRTAAPGNRIWRITPDGSVEPLAHLFNGTFTFGPDGAIYVYEQVGTNAVISRVFTLEPPTIPDGDPYDVTVENIEAAIAAKNRAIGIVGQTLANEVAAIEALNELREMGQIDPVNILQAKIRIFHAIHRQINARRQLQKGIEELEKSLLELQSEGKDEPGKRPDRPARRAEGPKLPRIR